MKAIFQASQADRQAGWVATYSSTKSNILHGMKARTGRNNKEQLGLSRVERGRENPAPTHHNVLGSIRSNQCYLQWIKQNGSHCSCAFFTMGICSLNKECLCIHFFLPRDKKKRKKKGKETNPLFMGVIVSSCSRAKSPGCKVLP